METAREVVPNPILELTQNSRLLSAAVEAGATDDELAALFGVSVSDLKTFEALIAKARAELALRVRRAFLAAAERGNSDALAYLAKKYLEESNT
jgi:hypothetical protein